MEAEMGTEVHGGSSGSDSRAVVDEDAQEGHTNGIHSAMQPPQKIACGFYHTAAINRSRDAWTWGRNQHGALGLDVGHQLPAAAQANRSAPVQVKAIKTDIYEVACAANHTVFLKKKADETGGVLFSSGLGNHGRLGAKQAAAGSEGGADDDELLELDTWSSARPMQVKFAWASGTRVLRVVCGGDHTICLATNRKLYTWGLNDHGQCGTGTNSRWHSKPTEVKMGKDSSIAHFAAGAQHSLAALSSGRLYVWGCGRHGRLGQGNTDSCSEPKAVLSIAEVHIVYVTGGESHSGAIDSQGLVWTWGAGSYGRLGHGEEGDRLAPRQVQFFKTMTPQGPLVMKSIAMGGFHTLFLEDSPRRGRMYSCGGGAAVGHLHEYEDDKIIYTPQAFGQLGKVIQVAAGMFHSLVLLETGELVTWGVGARGRLGHGNEKTSFQPKILSWDATNTGSEVVAANTSQEHKVAISTERQDDGEISLFDKSELRDQAKNSAGSDSNMENPYQVAQITCGAMHSFARTNGGLLFGWGCGANGQLGFVLPGSHYCWIPTELKFGHRIVKHVCAGREHTLAVTTSEEFWSWGRGTEGQLGNGRMADQFTPSLLPDMTPVVSFSAGEVHSAAIIRSRSSSGEDRTELYTWGSADNGLLGLGAVIVSGPQNSPVEVDFGGEKSEEHGAMSKHPLQVVCGPNHTVVICGCISDLDQVVEVDSSKGQAGHTQVWTFGNGWYGRLGLGHTHGQFSPAQVKMRGVSARMVALGADHTCVVSSDKHLFVWGRGQALGETEDILYPKKHPFLADKEIKTVVCGERHTLVLTTDGEIWGWGDNQAGQLGLGPKAPKDVKVPTGVRQLESAELLATGSNFSLAQLGDGEMYAWGEQSCGRLGLAAKKPDKIVYHPELVSTAWTTIEAMNVDKRRAPSSPNSEVKARSQDTKDAKVSKKKVLSFVMLQTILKQELPECHEDELKLKEVELESKLAELRRDIGKLPRLEEGMRKLETKLGESLGRNIRWFKVSEPVPEDRSVDPRLHACRTSYEKLLWVLQQQCSYLGQLSQLVSEEELEVLHYVIDRLFASNDARTRSLHQAMLRLMINKEVEATGSTLDRVFDGDRSPAFHAFSRWALSEVNCAEVMPPFLGSEKTEEKTETGERSFRATVLLEAQASASRSEWFFLSYSDFKDQEEDKNKEETELLQMYTQRLDKFRVFMMGPFLKMVKGTTLPKAIRQILLHALQATKRWKDQVLPHLADLSQELRMCEPALRLYLSGIVCPLLRNASAYATPAFLLLKSSDILKGDEKIEYNLQVIAEFLQQMLNNTISSKEKILNLTAKAVREELLKYVEAQARIEDDLVPELLEWTFKTQFSREGNVVTMQLSSLMRLSNILKENSNRIRMKEHDAVQQLIKDIPEWEKDAIMVATYSDVQFNFFLDPRFMMHNDEIVSCSSTSCPLPAWVCHDNASHRLVKTNPSSMSDDDPKRFLEGLLRVLQPLTSKTFTELKDECKELIEAAVREEEQNIKLMGDLEKAIRLIQELIDVGAQAEDVMQVMSETVKERDRHSRYLQLVEKNVQAIEKAKAAYADFGKGNPTERENAEGEKDKDKEKERSKPKLEQLERQLDQAVSQSLALELPQKLKDKATSGGYALALQTIQRKMQSFSPYDAKEMAEELGCSMVPMATFSVKKLKAMKVVMEIHPPFTVMQTVMNITVRKLEAGDAELVASVSQGKSQNVVKRIKIPTAKLTQMKHAEKNDTTDFGEPPFLTCLSANFMDLIVKLEKGG